MSAIEDQLRGGHPNSLGRTIEVVDLVLRDPSRFDELFQCYFSNDEVVRLRVSNAMKRICRAKKELLLPYIDHFLNEIAGIDQASAQWTLAQLFLMLEKELSPEQMKRAKEHLSENLQNHTDWIVLNMTIETLSKWALTDDTLKSSIVPELIRLEKDHRKSVASKAKKALALLS